MDTVVVGEAGAVVRVHWAVVAGGRGLVGGPGPARHRHTAGPGYRSAEELGGGLVRQDEP